MKEFLYQMLVQIPEPVYFSLFLIYGKKLKEKRLLFIFIMILEYFMITKLIKFDVWIHILYIAMTYINLKVLYKEKAQVTDIFLFGVASLILILISALSYAIIYFTIRKYVVALILNRILLFLFLYCFKNKLNLIYKKFYTLWNRHSKPNKIRSLTLRNISVIIFNLMFWIINIGMAFSYVLNS